MTTSLTTIERSSQGLREVLFSEIDALRNGVIEPARAHATAKLAQQILTSVALELSAARLLDSPPDGKGRSLPKLKLVG